MPPSPRGGINPPRYSFLRIFEARDCAGLFLSVFEGSGEGSTSPRRSEPAGRATLSELHLDVLAVAFGGLEQRVRLEMHEARHNRVRDRGDASVECVDVLVENAAAGGD